MMKQGKGQKETADQAYHIALGKLKHELRILSNKIDDHRINQKSNKLSWGQSGDLKYLIARIAELNEFLTPEQPALEKVKGGWIGYSKGTRVFIPENEERA